MRISDWSSDVCSSDLVPGPAAWLVDRERQAAFEQAPSPFDDVVKAVRREHFESAYYLTLLYLPPPDQVSRAERALLEVPPEERGLDYRDYLKAFVAETESAFDLLAGIIPECAPPVDAEPLPHLQTTVSPPPPPDPVPQPHINLHALLPHPTPARRPRPP